MQIFICILNIPPILVDAKYEPPKNSLFEGKSSAFTDDEMEKLRYHSAPEKPTLFTGDLYFPFLICEVKVRSIIKNYILCLLTCVTFKCGENGLNIADRQNARSASTAILQLYPTVSRTE